MFKNAKNTKTQGDIGLGSAISYFTQEGMTVLIPLTDSQDYDLVVEINKELKKIQVKTTSYKKHGSFKVSLSVKGGNRSYNTIKKFDKNLVDLVFVLTSDGDKYLFPSPSVTSSITINDKYKKYKI